MNYDRIFINHRAKEKLGELRKERVNVNVEKNSAVMIKTFLIILFLIIIMKLLVK